MHMLLFEFDDGRLLPAQFGSSTGGEIDPDVMLAVRDYVLQIIGRPLFAVHWGTDSRGAHAAPGDPDSLIAMDASGQVVTVEVKRLLDSRRLVAALAQSGQTATLGWLDLASLYPGGSGAFRRDWNAFRESLPPRPMPGARLYIVTGKILDEVRPALELLADSGVEVFEVTQRGVSDGRTFVEVTEPYRISVPTISAQASLEAIRRPAIEAESDLQRVASPTPDGAGEPVQVPAAEVEVQEAPVVTAGVPTPSDPVTEEVVREEVALAETATPEDTPATLEEPHPALRALAAAAAQELPLVWVQLRKGLRHEALITRDGLVTLSDGRQFADPSTAAVAASGRHAADGWRVWRIGEGGRTLEDAVLLVVGDEAPLR